MPRPKNIENLSHFSNKIAELRKSHHLTQPELAKELGCTREMIAYYESRSPNPTLDVIKLFADYFKVSTDELIYENNARSGKIGPKPKLEKQLNQLLQLPKSKQKTVSDMLDGILK
jgi:transcriptional regulator with XRE-family HTH domain